MEARVAIYTDQQQSQIKVAYLQMGAHGIVAFLNAMDDLYEDEQEEFLKLTLKRLGKRKTKYDDPFHYFGNLLSVIQKQGLHEGIRILDRTFGETALMWQSTGETNQ